MTAGPFPVGVRRPGPVKPRRPLAGPAAEAGLERAGRQVVPYLPGVAGDPVRDHARAERGDAAEHVRAALGRRDRPRRAAGEAGREPRALPHREAPCRPRDDLAGHERQVRREPPRPVLRQVLQAAQVRTRPPSLTVDGRVVHAHQHHGRCRPGQDRRLQGQREPRHRLPVGQHARGQQRRRQRARGRRATAAGAGRQVHGHAARDAERGRLKHVLLHFPGQRLLLRRGGRARPAEGDRLPQPLAEHAPARLDGSHHQRDRGLVEPAHPDRHLPQPGRAVDGPQRQLYAAAQDRPVGLAPPQDVQHAAFRPGLELPVTEPCRQLRWVPGQPDPCHFLSVRQPAVGVLAGGTLPVGGQQLQEPRGDGLPAGRGPLRVADQPVPRRDPLAVLFPVPDREPVPARARCSAHTATLDRPPARDNGDSSGRIAAELISEGVPRWRNT
jgi:hypothetical protein